MIVKNNNLAKSVAVILAISSLSLSFEGCNNIKPVDQEPVNAEITESNPEPIAQDLPETPEDEPEQEVIADDNIESDEISSDTGSQLKIIADNYDLFCNTMNPDGGVYPGSSISVTDLNHNGRLEAIVSTCQGSGAFSTTYFFEISSDYSSLDILDINGDKSSDYTGDFLASEMYAEDDYDYTVYDCYKKGDEYYYLIEDYCSSGWPEKYIAYYSYSINEGIKRDLLGGCLVAPDSDIDILTVHTKLLDSLNEHFADKESYLNYMNEYWSEYEKQSCCAVKWVALSDEDDFLESITRSYNSFNPEFGQFDVIDYDYEDYFSSYYQDYKYTVEAE